MLAGRSLLFVGPATRGNDPLRRSLHHHHAVAEFAETCADAERLLPRCHFDCVVVQVESASDPALAWIESLRREADAPGVYVVARDDAAIAAACQRAGVSTVLPSPLDAKALVGLLEVPRPVATPAASAASTRRLAGAAPAIRTHLIGDSPPMRRVRSIVERVAPTSATVLIEGETGTGKELVARSLHERSGRRGPFVPVNCGAIPAELMESELFGHARGAFTGAHQQREGLFLAARGGTLFLDEVSEMRSDLQVKLLRALEESRIRPVGADREIPIDARIVASSQPGLRDRVRERRFREDLYFRLNVVHVQLPSLRERPEDVAALVQHFMHQVADEFGVAPTVLDAAQVARLRTRAWPGNVRELRNYVERTVVMGETPEDDSAGAAPDAAAEPDGHYPLDWTLEQVKQAHIVRVLERNRGNRTAAARQLGVSRRTLERRLAPGAEATTDDD
jgi:DNA-binding NtrC family response regulator